MPRVQSNGIKYFSFDVDFFSDPKVKILKARYGTDGIAIYLYCLCLIYREGYYVKVDDDLYYVISDELKLSTETVEQVMTFLLKRSMLNEQLFKSDAILTGAGIQDRWQKAVKARAQKTPIVVSDYWLLGREETEPFIKCTLFEDFSEKNEDNSKNYEDNSKNYDHKVNKSKVNKNKINNIDDDSARTRVRSIFFELWEREATELELDTILNLMQKYDADESLLREAIKAAGLYGRPTVSYVRGILKNEQKKRDKGEACIFPSVAGFDKKSAEKLRELNRRK